MMKKLLLGALWLLTLAAAFGVGTLYLAFRNGLFASDYASDEQIRQRITDAGVVIPESASHLTYLCVGFEEPFLFIGMEVAPAEREALVVAWLGAAPDQWRAIPENEVANYTPAIVPGRKLSTPRLNLDSFVEVTGYRFSDNPTLYEKAALWERVGRKVILYSWRE